MTGFDDSTQLHHARKARMANLIYKRVSTDQQSTARQNVVLADAQIDDPTIFEEEAGTSSRLHPLRRPKFVALLDYARPGDTIHVSEMFRLVRDNQHILDVLDVLHERRLFLTIHDGAFSSMDLTARHPRTGELLSTVKFMVQTLAAAGELQRDLQRELTYDGLRAAEAQGRKGGRRPAVSADDIPALRTRYIAGDTIAGLARAYNVSRGAVRTALGELLSQRAPSPRAPSAPEQPVTLSVPGKIADLLRGAELSTAERAALEGGEAVRRGQGYTLSITAPLEIHRQLLARCDTFDGSPAQRKARREYAARFETLSTSR